MKFVIAIGFSLLIGFSSLIPVMDYVVNYKYYSEVLCINKNNPDLHCNGKCQLAKELAKTSENSSEKNEVKLITLKIDSFIFDTFKSIYSTNLERSSTKNNFFYLNLYNFINYRPIERPPIMLCSYF